MIFNGQDYKSRWDYMATKTGGPKKATLGQPEDSFQIMGWFEGEWMEEVNLLMEKYNIKKGFNFLTKLGDVNNSTRVIKPYTYEMDKYDMEEVMGISLESEFVSKLTTGHLIESRDICPNLWKMIDWFGFKGQIIPKIHIQLPGQIFPFHYDEFTSIRNNVETTDHDLDIDPNKFARIEVQLLDWDFGHVWGLGNTYWKDWKAGEIMWHNWYDMPHGTANCGITPRICLQITGEVDSVLFQKLRQNNGVIKISDL